MPQADCFYKIRTVYSFFFSQNQLEKKPCVPLKKEICVVTYKTKTTILIGKAADISTELASQITHMARDQV